jgi:hypothetical protein
MTGKLSVQVEAFTPRRSNTLVGFATIIVPEMRLRIHDITIHEKGSARWVGLPGKPLVDRYGVAKRNDDGKLVYAPVLEFIDKATRSAFSAKVIAALLALAPAAFDEAAA